MGTDTKRKLLNAQRELSVLQLKARVMLGAWLSVPVIVACIVWGAFIASPGVLGLLLLPVGMVIALLTLGFEQGDGVYIEKRRVQWEIEDLRETLVSEIMEG